MTNFLKRLRGLFAREKPVEPEPTSRADKYANSALTGILQAQREATTRSVEAFFTAVNNAQRRVKTVRVRDAAPGTAITVGGAMDAMDSEDNGIPSFKAIAVESGQSLLRLMPWFMQQGFIGYQNAAFIAQNWLIYKACATPVDDAIRNGYDITTVDGEDLDEDVLKILKAADREHGIIGQLREFGTKGRIFGLRLALFEVDSQDPEYYEKPFNIDSVKPGSYQGISQVDPYWCAPILDMEAAGVPSSKHFYEPTWWLMGSRRIHRSHLVVFRYADPPDVLKPLYLFGGIPLPQMIMERVYCAERTANEAPALALSKRTTVWLTDMAAVMGDSQKAQKLLGEWIAMRDNFGIKLGDKLGDEFQQFDTPLADFDQLIMTQYGLVASTAGMPITRLLGTTPGGFAATGEYDEACYHEMEESMQERDFSPLVARHHQMVMRSEVIPKHQEMKDVDITITWRELDAMTSKERADENLVKAQTGAALIAAMALTPEDERARVSGDKESGYHGIGVDLEREPDPLEEGEVDPEAAAEASRSGAHAAGAAVQTEEAEGLAKKPKAKRPRPKEEETA